MAVPLCVQVDASNAAAFKHVHAAVEAAPASVSLPFMHHEVLHDNASCRPASCCAWSSC